MKEPAFQAPRQLADVVRIEIYAERTLVRHEPVFRRARIETVDSAPAFRDAFKSKRCLIPASAFYEWTLNRADGKKDPWHIHLPGDQPFSFAGLWAYNDKLGVTSCTIVTMPAGDTMKTLHDRQPVILDPAAYREWLDVGTAPARAKELLQANLDKKVEFHRVSRDVNSSKFEGKPAPEVNSL